MHMENTYQKTHCNKFFTLRAASTLNNSIFLSKSDLFEYHGWAFHYRWKDKLGDKLGCGMHFYRIKILTKCL